MKHQRETAEAKRKAEEEKERLGMEKFDLSSFSDQTLFSLLEIRLKQSQFLDKPINLI